ncbi:MAG: S8 family serine peptidase [Candidatus Cloacimonetes bacterium]|nr:S8 family serine peptidase [Candidatus Cloacimonadota bacterium]
MRPVISGLIVLATSLILKAGELSPGLQTLLSRTPDREELKVLVVLEDQAPISVMDREMHEARTPMAVRHARVIRSLQDVAARSQPAVEQGLKDLQLAGKVLGYTPYWLVNAFVVRTTADMVPALAGLNGVSLVEPDLVVELIEPVTPPASREGEREIGITEALRSMDVDRVWYELGIRGEGAIVGNLDTGVNVNHESLVSRWRGNDAPASECWLDVLGASTTPSDGNGHGSHVMGTITGLASGDSIGVAPEATWIACNAINQSVGAGFDNDVLDALQWFSDPDGNPDTDAEVPDVIQNSWGVAEFFSGYVDCDSRWWTAIDNCEAAGVVLTWSAGNEGSGAATLRSPADRALTPTSCFSVGSTIQTAPFTISDFSSRGPTNCTSDFPIKPEVVAPGSDIYSADGFNPTGYVLLSGTSMAGPHVAGVVGLMRSANPELDVESIKQILMDTATDLGQPGEDNTYGHGFVNAYAAVQAAMVNWVTVSGVVRDGQGMAPLAGARIRVDGAGIDAFTEPDGSYSVTLMAEPRTFTVSVWGYASQSALLELVEGEDLVRDWVLQAVPNAVLSGVVHDAGGNPLQAALVSVLDTPLDPIYSAFDGSFQFTLPAGETYVVRSQGSSGAVSVPLGPDAHGYRAFDLADGDWDEQIVQLSPQGSDVVLQGVNRVENFVHLPIDPVDGGPGTALVFGQSDDNRVHHLDLPFVFMYYGQAFSEISVSANGWVALGYSDSEDFSGFDIPDPDDGPLAMLAPFWEDLSPQVSASGSVSTWYDQAGGQFVIEYNHIRQLTPTSALETFAVHLLDPAVHPSLSGDGSIVFWYGTVSNSDNTAVGIESPDGEDGLQIWNGRFDGSNTPGGLLSPTCVPIVSGAVVLFTTGLGEPQHAPPLPVQDLSITTVGGMTHLLWSASGGALTYRVERSIDGGPWQVLGTTADTQWMEPRSLGNRRFRVVAQN